MTARDSEVPQHLRGNGAPVQEERTLTRLELDLLRYFASHERRVIGRDELLEHGRREGVDFEYVQLDDEGHGGWSDQEMRVRVLKLMTDFFDRRLNQRAHRDLRGTTHGSAYLALQARGGFQ